LIYFIIQNIFGQELTAEYQVIWQGYNVKKFLLKKNDSLSLWYLAPKNSEKIIDTTVSFKETKYKYNTYETMHVSNPVYDLYDFNKFVLRDYNKQQIIFTDIFKNKRIFVRDSFFDMHWKMSDETKHINGYKCLSAMINFRGRAYKAFFAPDIPVSIGPWKFNNLPGLIVEVISLDGEYQFRLIHLKMENIKNLKLPEIPEDEILSWSNYVSMIRKYYDDKIAYARAKHREKKGKGGAGIKISNIEVIHPIFSPGGVQLYEMKK